MNKKILVKPIDSLTDTEASRLVAELNTIGGFDFVIESPRALEKIHRESLENEKAIFDKYAKPQTPKKK